MAKWNIWKKITETISKSKTWLDGQSNAVKVLCAGAMSVIIFVLTYFVAIKNSNSSSNSNGNSVGYWNFIILIVSAPVAFVIWHFRDENNRQQIENQRKDINLKEFQKLSEWVSGAHLPEIKTVSKTTQKSSLKDGAEITEQPTEQSEEYAKRPDTTDFDTFSKRDGAIALQISAIYNLLPFFRGDYGESFRRPAFNLLKSAWQAMQQDSLKKLDEGNLFYLEREKIFDELEQRAESPMGVALTQVLLSLNRENKKLNLRDFPEMLPNICFAGMNFHLSGVSEIARDLSELDLSGADFRGTMLAITKFQKSRLIGAKLDNANLQQVNLRGVNLEEANLQSADLREANLPGVDLRNSNLKGTKFLFNNSKNSNSMQLSSQNADLNATSEDVVPRMIFVRGVDIRESSLNFAKITEHNFIENIYPDWKKENNPEWEALAVKEQRKVMQKFCNETGMLIFDKSGTQIMPPP